jgi:hypothetical protein
MSTSQVQGKTVHRHTSADFTDFLTGAEVD